MLVWAIMMASHMMVLNLRTGVTGDSLTQGQELQGFLGRLTQDSGKEIAPAKAGDSKHVKK